MNKSWTLLTSEFNPFIFIVITDIFASIVFIISVTGHSVFHFLRPKAWRAIFLFSHSHMHSLRSSLQSCMIWSPVSASLLQSSLFSTTSPPDCVPWFYTAHSLPIKNFGTCCLLYLLLFSFWIQPFTPSGLFIVAFLVSISLITLLQILLRCSTFYSLSLIHILSV